MSAQQTLIAKYGEPDHAYIGKFCEVWNVGNEFPWFPVRNFLVNRDFEIMLRIAFQALEKAGLHTEIKTYDGCYNDRSVRGSQTTSLHAWAFALDINAKDNPMTMDLTHAKGTWSDAFIHTMKAAGIFFGGDFHNRKDPMHWAGLDG